jgi:hypothetical protein
MLRLKKDQRSGGQKDGVLRRVLKSGVLRRDLRRDLRDLRRVLRVLRRVPFLELRSEILREIICYNMAG